MRKNKKLLLIVDAQRDFIDGTLPVPNATEAISKLSNYLKNNAKDYDFIIMTADWHPLSHCSFKENGGEWPKHCVQHTVGAAIDQGIIDALDVAEMEYTVLTKGEDEAREEYSIFNSIMYGPFLDAFNKFHELTDVDICGIAGDVCVLNTLRDAIRHFPKVNFRVLSNFSPSLDGGRALKEFAENTERVSYI